MVDQEQMVMVKGKRSKRPRLESPGAASSSTTAADDAVSFGGGEEEDMANCLILLANGSSQACGRRTAGTPPGFYQCKTCSKSFPSFQALGGHRASHTKPAKDETKKPADKQWEEDSSPDGRESTILSLQIPSQTNLGIPAGKARVHECSICGAEFASGQALGGHMRRHRPVPAVAEGGKRPRSDLLALDLNLPPASEERESKFPFAAKEQVIVFSASSLVDCHY